MTNYVPRYRKKKEILAKRERELFHALKGRGSLEKLIRAAERVRAAKLGVFKAEQARWGYGSEPGPDHAAWMSKPVEQIIEEYQKALDKPKQSGKE